MDFSLIDDLPMADGKTISFTTAIITYPSDYDGLINVGIITEFLEAKFVNRKGKPRIVVAREDPDEKVQRIHFHVYIDAGGNGFNSIRPNSYFNIKLPCDVLVLIKDDTTREYKKVVDFKEEMKWDDLLASNMDSYCEENNYVEWKIINEAHPNIQVKNKKFGDNYLMLRYILKQKLVTRSAVDDLSKELKNLKCEILQLKEKEMELCNEKLLKCCNVSEDSCIEELIVLGKKYKDRLKKKVKSTTNAQKRDFWLWIKEKMMDENLTKAQIMNEIKSNDTWWCIYAANTVNYNNLLNECFRYAIPIKPKINYDYTFYIPRKLNDWLMWLNDWMRKWHTNDKLLEKRPKGLVLIGPSRIGKTQLLASFGDFTYICNMWNMDAWESKTSFTIMDDVDPVDNDKGMNFAWFKPFFGAQEVVTATDKYRHKRELMNGKPLVWLSNYDLSELFKRSVDLDYIQKNMFIIHLNNRPLYEKPEDWIEGHNDYVEFDPKSTWWYQNKVKPQLENIKPQEESDDDYDELQPLSERKKSLLEKEFEEDEYNDEIGRLIKKPRIEN